MPKKRKQPHEFLGGFLGLLKNLVTPTPNRNDDSAAKAEHDGVSSAGSGSARTKTSKTSGWRPAASIVALRDQVNAVAPHRSIASDGMVGDANHKKKTSDHNPWVDDGGVGVVTAIDITHDPARGCDAGLLAEAIVASKDKRVKYVIWNRRISNFQPMNGKPSWAWRPYTGSNPHDKHVHVSVRPDKAFYDDVGAWSLPGAPLPARANTDGIAVIHDAAEAIAWGAKVAPTFKQKVIEIANRLQVDPSVLMAVMAFETGREFKSGTLNRASGATGLIQFMPSTATSLGTTTAKLAAMSEVKQLDFVEAYLKPYTGKMNDVASAYMAVLWPKAVPQALSFVLFEAPSKAYKLNKGLDADDDGKVTKAEASAKVSQQLVEGMRPENIG